MAELKILFRINPELINRLERKCLLKPAVQDTYTGVDGVITQYLRTMYAPALSSSGAFVSRNYRAWFGKGEFPYGELKRDVLLPTSQVIGIGMNTAERYQTEGRVQTFVEGMEAVVQRFRQQIKYIGILHCQHQLINAKELEKIIDSVL
ncbi:hypothetical protein H6504_05345 [Candidatus Woesearchaeota archaeon]|nr:hypothetical protein [Candidatus Woesearchaeota archaeon]